MTTTGHVYSMQLVRIRNNKIHAALTQPQKHWWCMNSCHSGREPLIGIFATDARNGYAALLWHRHALAPQKKALAICMAMLGAQVQKWPLARSSPHWQGHSMLMAFMFMVCGSYAAKVWLCSIALWWYITMWPVAAPLHQCHPDLFGFLEECSGGFPPTTFLLWPLMLPSIFVSSTSTWTFFCGAFFFGGASGSSFWVNFESDLHLTKMHVYQDLVWHVVISFNQS